MKGGNIQVKREKESEILREVKKLNKTNKTEILKLGSLRHL